MLPLSSSIAGLFQFLGTILSKITSNFKCQKWSFVSYIVSFSGLKMVFCKLSLARYHCFHKKWVYNGFKLSYFISSIMYRTSLQIFIFYKFFSTNLSKVELEIFRNCSTIFKSHWSLSKKKLFLKIVIFTERHLCLGLFFNKVAGL